jgi:hypothetical protein
VRQVVPLPLVPATVKTNGAGLTPQATSPLATWLSYLEHLHSKTIDLGLARVSEVARQTPDAESCRPPLYSRPPSGRFPACGRWCLCHWYPLATWLSYLEHLHSKTIDLGLARVSEVARQMDIVKPEE